MVRVRVSFIQKDFPSGLSRKFGTIHGPETSRLASRMVTGILSHFSPVQ